MMALLAPFFWIVGEKGAFLKSNSELYACEKKCRGAIALLWKQFISESAFLCTGLLVIFAKNSGRCHALELWNNSHDKVFRTLIELIRNSLSNKSRFEFPLGSFCSANQAFVAEQLLKLSQERPSNRPDGVKQSWPMGKRIRPFSGSPVDIPRP